jgi:hypothetical protein
MPATSIKKALVLLKEDNVRDVLRHQNGIGDVYKNQEFLRARFKAVVVETQTLK